jgi:hypothetical protein
MESAPKPPQEQALQMSEAYPIYSGYFKMPDEHAARLAGEAMELKTLVAEGDVYTTPDNELMQRVTEVTARAEVSGVWDPSRGEGADERIAHGTERNRGRNVSEEEATRMSIEGLKQNGLLHAIRQGRKEKERQFREPTESFIHDHELDADVEKKEIEALLEKTVDTATITETERLAMSQAFPSGNFLYHGAQAGRLIQMLESGHLANVKALNEREAEAAQAEGRDVRLIPRNSGFEGVSWSMNGIDALPGDRYHLAGFVAAPETILGDDEQLSVPSRPAPNEVLQISRDIDSSKYYDAKTQHELYRTGGIFGEANSVTSGLISLKRWNTEQDHQGRSEPMLIRARQQMMTQPGFQDDLRKQYSIEDDGRIRINPDLLQQESNETSVSAVWLQAAIDTGRLEGTSLAGKDAADVIESLDAEKITELMAISERDWQPLEHTLEEGQRQADAVEIPVEKMYFVAPRKDAAQWLKVIARSAHKPAGVILYDGKKVRLENFATTHRGSHQELTHELQSVIEPREGHIDYAEVLGAEFNEGMRAGYKHQVIAEGHLGKRRSLAKADGKLVVTS